MIKHLVLRWAADDTFFQSKSIMLYTARCWEDALYHILCWGPILNSIGWPCPLVLSVRHKQCLTGDGDLPKLLEINSWQNIYRWTETPTTCFLHKDKMDDISSVSFNFIHSVDHCKVTNMNEIRQNDHPAVPCTDLPHHTLPGNQSSSNVGTFSHVGFQFTGQRLHHRATVDQLSLLLQPEWFCTTPAFKLMLYQNHQCSILPSFLNKTLRHLKSA